MKANRVDASWRERVDQVEGELKALKEETAQFQKQRQEIQRQQTSFSAEIKSEKEKFMAKMTEMQAESARYTEALQKVQARRVEAERIAREAQREYNDELVPLLQRAQRYEEDLKTREIPADALERESSEWAEEEEKMRREMNAFDREIVELRRSAEVAVSAMQEEALKAEADLKEWRMQRNLSEGLEPYVFPESVVAQNSDILRPAGANNNDNNQDGRADDRIRKGRSQSGRILSVVDSNQNNNNNNTSQMMPLKSALKNASSSSRPISRANSSSSNLASQQQQQQQQKQQLVEDDDSQIIVADD